MGQKCCLSPYRWPKAVVSVASGGHPRAKLEDHKVTTVHKIYVIICNSAPLLFPAYLLYLFPRRWPSAYFMPPISQAATSRIL